MDRESDQAWLAHLRELRAYELSFVIGLLQHLDLPASDIALLEIGAGTGAQARELARLGYRVSAVDIAESNYSSARVYPVTNYDGHRLPFSHGQFDLVFSSNVLEHIPHVVEFQKEIRRVLADDGLAVHVLPSPAWRFWTSAAYYLHLGGLLLSRRAATSALQRRALSKGPVARWKLLASALFPRRHGESGNWMTELWYFSRAYWIRLFEGAGWSVVRCEPSGIFYTGHSILGRRLPLGVRRRFATVLGSATNAFILRKSASVE